MVEVKDLENTIKNAANDIMVSGEKGDIARGVVLSSFIQYGAVSKQFSDVLAARSVAFLTPRTDANASEVDAGRAYFMEMLGAPERATMKDEPDRNARDRHNNKVNALVQQARYVATSLLAIEQAGAWKEFHPTKSKGAIKITLDGARRIWPDRIKSIDASEHDSIVLSHRAGAWRFSALHDQGMNVARHRGLVKQGSTRAVPLRDTMRAVVKSAESNDVKVLNTSNETQLAAFEGLISLIDMLNDKTFQRQLDSKVVAPFRQHVEAKLAEVQENMKKGAPTNGDAKTAKAA